jgi:photosystem II stability/assembly factor-like uncharacterized protein
VKLLVTLIVVFSLQSFAQWNRIEEIEYPFIYSALFNNDDIFVGGDSLYISRDRGLTWSSDLPSNQPIEITALFKTNNLLFLGTYGQGIFISSDNGQNWHQLNSGLGVFAKYAKKFVVAGDTVFYGSDGGGVYFHKLNTNYWQSYNENLPDNIAWTTNDIVISGNNILLSAGSSGFYYIRPKEASNWIEARIQSPGGGYTTPNTFFTFNNIVFAGSRAGIFRSFDNGISWEYVGINALPLNVISFVNNGNRIFAGLTRAADFFVWYSDDFGSTWNPLYHEFQGLRQLYIYDNKMWAATNDGLYYTELSPSYVEPDLNVNQFILEQNYPNPFNPSTKIGWQSPVSGHQTLKIYDVLGNEVATLVDEYRESGRYEVEFNVAQVSRPEISSGLYLYKLTVSNFSVIRKMMLIK